MNALLEYPFDSEIILKKRRAIKKELLESGTAPLAKNIAILGGSTTHDIKDILELFLLNQGIATSFYESEYGMYWQDAMFENPELAAFGPDIIIIHTTNRNITAYPTLDEDTAAVDARLAAEYEKFQSMWLKLAAAYGCPIIQNNFEYPYYRLMGNMDASDIHGRVNFITRLNMKFNEYAQSHDSFYINDINYLSSDYGLGQWSDPFYWHMYKYALSMQAIPALAYSLANIIKSIYGKNKKAFALDLDNTLWGGIVGDDGPDNLEIGQETSVGQVYSEFQEYLKAHKQMGILLNVISKNNEDAALSGLNHPSGMLKPDDFIVIKANWEPKSINLTQMADELTLLSESFVFVDDNPVERDIVRQQVPGAAVPELDKVEHYIHVIDRSGFFETTSLSGDDRKRNEMYKENTERNRLLASYENYGDYLLSLDMRANIRGFEPLYMARIAQLTNKSNQFNLTTRRYTQDEIEAVADDSGYITLYGQLEDRFGDNGIVSVVIGKLDGSRLHMDLWIMSCRVLKRDMEFAMMDELVRVAHGRGVTRIMGYYYPTAKNAMVRDFYEKQGFSKASEDARGNTVWHFDIGDDYQRKTHFINVNPRKDEVATCE